ncbi:MAG: hypothetical protein ACTHOI_12515, partial [Sphingomicrobium sp.]
HRQQAEFDVQQRFEFAQLIPRFEVGEAAVLSGAAAFLLPSPCSNREVVSNCFTWLFGATL